jgi:hypothetical protein
MKYKGHEVRDYECRYRECLALGPYQHRGACGASGSRNTGAITKCCLTNAYRGCPSNSHDPVAKPKRKGKAS